MMYLYALSVNELENQFVVDFLKSCKNVTFCPLNLFSDKVVSDEEYLKGFEKQKQYELPLEGKKKVKKKFKDFKDQFDFKMFFEFLGCTLEEMVSKTNFSVWHIKAMINKREVLTLKTLKILKSTYRHLYDAFCKIHDIDIDLNQESTIKSP